MVNQTSEQRWLVQCRLSQGIRKADEILTLESDTSDSDDNNASVNSEFEHESGISKPESVATTSISKGARRKKMVN
jgi:hypothetical protein